MSVSSTNVRLENDRIHVGPSFRVDFQRTVRLPNDGRKRPLPPGFGSFPLRRVGDLTLQAPKPEFEPDDFVLPIYRHEALWILFRAPAHPVAVRVDVGGVCALTGAHEARSLESDPQNYGIETWDLASALSVRVHLVDAREWKSITGEAPLRSPISIETYTSLGLPWFELADSELDDLSVSPTLAAIKPIEF